MTTNHPAHGPVSLDRLHQIREILSKAAAQSDGGNLGYAMADAVKVIDGAIAAFSDEPVAWRYRYVHTPKTEEQGSPFTTEWKLCDSQDECNPSDCFERQPLYTTNPAPVSVPDLKPVGFLFVSDDGAVAYSPADWPMKGFNLIGKIYGDLNASRAATLQVGNSPVTPDCWCRTCRPVTMSDMRFIVCPECGNKRCPHANDHRNACTGSNEPGQEGSAYPAAPQQEVK